MIEEKRALLVNITEYFMHKGFYKTTMDEVAAELKISKKTIYKYFPSKEYLLNLMFSGIAFTARNGIVKIINSDKSSVEKLAELINHICTLAARVNFDMLSDIKKLGPHFWNKIEKFRARQIYANISKVIIQGQEEGYIIDVPKEIIVEMLVASVQAIVTPEFVIKNSFSITQAGQMTFTIFINGILTDEGKALYKKLKMESI